MTSIIGLTAIFLIMRNETVVNMFKRFGEYSLQLYLFNVFFLVASRTLIVNILGMTNPVVIISFNMIVDFYLSYLIIKYMFTYKTCTYHDGYFINIIEGIMN